MSDTFGKVIRIILFASFLKFVIVSLKQAQPSATLFILNSPIFSLVLLLALWYLINSYIPFVGKGLRTLKELLKKFLLFCWHKEPNSTGAKNVQNRTRYRNHRN